MSLVRTAGESNAQNVREVTGDITLDGNWQAEVAEFAPDWCFHLAWSGLPDYSLANCRTNVDASIGLLEALVQAKVARVIVAGSCWEYGRASGAVREDALPIDYGVFAAAKHACRALLDATSREVGFEYRWARVFFAYGPGQRTSSLVPHLRAAARAGQLPDLRTPGAVQDFVHVDDVARGLFMLAQCDAPSGVFNIGSGHPSTADEIADLVERYYGLTSSRTTVVPGSGFWADSTRITAATGWRPEIGLNEGLASTLREMDATH